MRRLAFKLGSCVATPFQFLILLFTSAWALTAEAACLSGMVAAPVLWNHRLWLLWRVIPQRAQNMSAEDRVILDRVARMNNE
jgi:hypothetical protein